MEIDVDLSTLRPAELTAIQRALLEARFPEVENDQDVWLSPFVIELHVAVVDEQRRRLIEAGDQKGLTSLEGWLNWDERSITNRILERRILANAVLRSMVSERPEVIRDFIRPFVVSDARLREISRKVSSTDSAE